MDWEKIREECVRTGEIIKVQKEEGMVLPSYFHETHLGIDKGAIRQYRDERPTQTLHIHEFPEYFLVHVDTFNPEYHPVAHGIVDTPGITVAIILGAVAIYYLVKTAKGLNLVPEEENAN
jgi:hypothetical protein